MSWLRRVVRRRLEELDSMGIEVKISGRRFEGSMSFCRRWLVRHGYISRRRGKKRANSAEQILQSMQRFLHLFRCEVLKPIKAAPSGAAETPCCILVNPGIKRKRKSMMPNRRKAVQQDLGGGLQPLSNLASATLNHAMHNRRSATRQLIPTLADTLYGAG